MNASHRDWSGQLEPPVAFVLSGGASLGAVHVGMLRALSEVGLEPDLIVATSVGALNGTVVADRGDLAEAVEVLDEVWRALSNVSVLPGGRITRGLRLAAGWSMHSNAGLRKLIDRVLHAEAFAELSVPTAVLVTEVMSGRPLLVQDGDLEPALLASAAIPGVFPSVEVHGELGWDGGLSANVPLRPAADLGARSLVVLDAVSACQRIDPPDTAAEAVVDAVHAMLRQRVRIEAPLVAEAVAVLYLDQPCAHEVHPLDFSGSGELIEEGHRVAAEFLADADVPRSGRISGDPDRHSDHPAVERI